jgi:hypothetical protein
VKDTTPKLQEVIAAVKPNLSDAESWDLEEFLTEYEDIFVMDSVDYGRTDRMYHFMDMVETGPNREPLRSLPLAKETNVNEIFEDMQRRGVIEESQNPGHPPSFSSGGRTGTCAFAWTTEN